MGKPDDMPPPQVSAPPPAYSDNPVPAYGQPPPGGYAQPPPGGYAQPPPGGYAPQQPPPGGYAPQQQPPPGGYAPQQGQAAAPTQVTVVQGGTGNCPQCRIGYRTENYTCCGIALAILFFPLGLICCLLMKESKCSHCGQPL